MFIQKFIVVYRQYLSEFFKVLIINESAFFIKTLVETHETLMY